MNRTYDEFITALHKKHSEHLAQLAYRRIGDKDLSRDLVQETFLTACFKVELLYNHENPAGWLYKTLYNLVFREMNRAYHSQEIPLNEEINTLDISTSFPLEYSLPKELTPDEKNIICWRLERGLPYSEIAEMEGITPEACRKRFSRAIQKCREIFYMESDGLFVT